MRLSTQYSEPLLLRLQTSARQVSPAEIVFHMSPQNDLG